MRRDYPSEVMEIASFCTNGGRVSRNLVSRKHLSITKYMSHDICDFLDIT